MNMYEHYAHVHCLCAFVGERVQQPSSAECAEESGDRKGRGRRGEEEEEEEEEKEGWDTCSAAQERAVELHVFSAGAGAGGQWSRKGGLGQSSHAGLLAECRVSIGLYYES